MKKRENLSIKVLTHLCILDRFGVSLPQNTLQSMGCFHSNSKMMSKDVESEYVRPSTYYGKTIRSSHVGTRRMEAKNTTTCDVMHAHSASFEKWHRFSNGPKSFTTGTRNPCCEIKRLCNCPTPMFHQSANQCMQHEGNKGKTGVWTET